MAKSKKPLVSNEDKPEVERLYAEGYTPKHIARKLNLEGRSVSATCLNLPDPDEENDVKRPLTSNENRDAPQTPIGELVDGVEKLKKLAGDAPQQPPPDKAFEKGLDAADKAQERAEKRAAKSTPDEGGLFPLLESMMTQQTTAHTQMMERMDTSHKHATQRIKDESDARIKEMEIKHKREAEEAEAKRKDEKEREREYWDRMGKQRAEEQKALEKLRIKENEMVQEKLETLTKNVDKQLEHANELISTREESSRESIKMQQHFSDELTALKRKIGGSDQVEKIAEMAIEKLGKPIINVIEGRVVGDNGESAKGDAGMGALGDIGQRLAKGFKDGFMREVAPQIKEYSDKFSEWIVKDLPIAMVLKQLEAWAEDPKYGKYVQAAVSFIAMNNLDELLKQGRDYLGERAKEVLATDKAKTWYQRLRDAILAQYRAEDERIKEYVQDTNK